MSAVNVCSRCGLMGYEYADKLRRLCHLCVERNRANAEISSELKEIFTVFMDQYKDEWPMAHEYCKASTGNGIVQAIKKFEPEWKVTL